MKNQKALDLFREAIVKDGIARVTYDARDIHDIVHPFSVKGYELLSDGFAAFLEQLRPILPKKTPIAVTLSGKTFSKEEKERINNTVWTHFCLLMTRTDKKVKDCLLKCLRFLIYTVLSLLLLKLTEVITNYLAVLLIYMPFYFFGFRLMIYLIVDCLPLWKERRWYRRLASMKLVFSDDTEELSPEAIREEISAYACVSDQKAERNQIALRLSQKKKLEEICFRSDSLEELLQQPRLQGQEMLGAAPAAYLANVEEFFTADCRLRFVISGKKFSSEEQSRVSNAFRNYYGLHLAQAQQQLITLRQQNLLFLGLFILSAALFVLLGNQNIMFLNEVIMLGFWFFSDFFMDISLLSLTALKAYIRILENCVSSEVSFDPEKEQA